MKFTYALTAAAGFAGSALSAPAGLLPTDALSGITDIADLDAGGVSPDVLKGLVSPVTGLVGGLGLGGAAPGLSGTVSSLTGGLGGLGGLTGRQEIPGLDELPEIPGLDQLPEVPGLSPKMVVQTISGSTAVFQQLNIKDIQNLDVAKAAPVPGLDADVLKQIVEGLTDILGKLELQQHVQKVLEAAPSTDQLPLDLASPTKFSELEGGLPVGLLAAIAPSVATLLTALGLGGLAPGLVSLLGVLSDGL